MISKELLSEVINIKIEDIIDLKMFGKDLKYYEKCLLKSCCDGRLSNHKDSIYKSINIYELAHKCKEWAFEFRFDNKPTNNRYYRQRSGYEDKFNVEKQKREKLGYMTLTFGCLGHTKTFYADTEPEAIFKACQWILDNKKEGN